MFGLSLTKVLFTFLVFAVVWKGSALLARHAADLRKGVAQRADRHRQRRAEAAAAKKVATVDLEPCARCGAYVDPRHGCPRCSPDRAG